MAKRLNAKPIAIAIATLFLVAIALAFALDKIFPPALDKVATSVVITDREGAWLHAFTVDDAGEKRWRLQ